MPVVAPPVSDLAGETPPWLRGRSGSAPIHPMTPPTAPAPNSGQSSLAGFPGSGPAASDWGAQRSSAPVNEPLPNLNTPFTSLDAARREQSAPRSGGGSLGQYGSFGSQRSQAGYSAARGPSSLHGAGTDSQAANAYGVSSASAMGRMPYGPPAYPEATFPRTSAEADTLMYSAPPVSGVSVPRNMPVTPAYMPPPSTPMNSAPSMAPMAGYGRAMTAEAPTLTTHEDLRAALPGSRMSEPPARGEAPRERRTLLWVIIALLLIIMIVAVIVLLRGLETPPSGALWPLFAV